MRKISVVILLMSLVAFTMPSVVSAVTPQQNQGGFLGGAQDTLKSGGEAAYGQGASTDLPVLVGRIINVLIAMVGIVLVVYIIRGGFYYMTAGGAPEQVEKGKKFIINGVIGLIIILLAYSITAFVVNRLTQATTGTSYHTISSHLV